MMKAMKTRIPIIVFAACLICQIVTITLLHKKFASGSAALNDGLMSTPKEGVLDGLVVPNYKGKEMTDIGNTSNYMKHVPTFNQAMPPVPVPDSSNTVMTRTEITTLDRCALCFFGLPRAYKTMVLPSIVRNLLLPNARHNCDVYVHYYRVFAEAVGRRNPGRAIDPDAVLLLEEAAKDVAMKEHRPATWKVLIRG